MDGRQQDGQGVDIRDEAVASGGHGFDEAGLARIFVQGLSEETYRAGEGAFADRCVTPDGVEKFLLTDEAAAILDELEEQAKGLGFESDGDAIREEAEGAVVGLEPIEAEDHRGGPLLLIL